MGESREANLLMTKLQVSMVAGNIALVELFSIKSDEQRLINVSIIISLHTEY